MRHTMELGVRAVKDQRSSASHVLTRAASATVVTTDLATRLLEDARICLRLDSLHGQMGLVDMQGGLLAHRNQA